MAKTTTFSAPAQVTKEMTIPVPSYWILKHATEFARTGVAVLSEDTALTTAFIRSQGGKVTYAGTVLQSLASIRGFADGSLQECTKKDFEMLRTLSDGAIEEFKNSYADGE